MKIMMTKCLWACVALVALFVTVESLTCNICEVGILGTCFKKSTMNCSKDQTMCYIGEAKFNLTELLTIHARGCLDGASCKNGTGTVLTAGYTVTRNCCNTNLCNGAASTQFPMAAALGAALVAIWSAWGQ